MAEYEEKYNEQQSQDGLKTDDSVPSIVPKAEQPNHEEQIKQAIQATDASPKPQVPTAQAQQPQQPAVQPQTPSQVPQSQQVANQPQQPGQASPQPQQPTAQQPNSQPQQPEQPEQQQRQTVTIYDLFGTGSSQRSNQPKEDSTPMTLLSRAGWFALGFVGGFFGMMACWLMASSLSPQRRRQATTTTWIGFLTQAVLVLIWMLMGNSFPFMQGSSSSTQSTTGSSSSAFG